MEGKLGQSPTVLFKYKKLILAEEKTASAGFNGSRYGAAVRHRAFLLFRP